MPNTAASVKNAGSTPRLQRGNFTTDFGRSSQQSLLSLDRSNWKPCLWSMPHLYYCAYITDVHMEKSSIIFKYIIPNLHPNASLRYAQYFANAASYDQLKAQNPLAQSLEISQNAPSTASPQQLCSHITRPV